MDERFVRTALIFGDEGMSRLMRSRVAVFGVGGVGGHCVQALARAGVGAIDVFDDDAVSVTNINRQAVAMTSTLGRPKVEVIRDQILDINPDANVIGHKCFYLPETAGQFDFSKYDYVVDCIDTVTGKIQLIEAAKAAGVPVISSMGAGNKLDPTAFQVADISKTSVCPLAKVMRRELKKRNIKNVKVVYSQEEPVEAKKTESFVNEMERNGKEENNVGRRKSVPGSIAFVPSVAGLILAGEVIKDLTAEQQKG